MEGAGADAAVVLTLAKAPPAAPWAALGTAECAVKRPVVTVRARGLIARRAWTAPVLSRRLCARR